MAHYKIINITDKLGKRQVSYNSTLDIKYSDGLYNKSTKLGVGQELILEAISLPPSIHRLRAQKLVNVVKISKAQHETILNPPKVKPVIVEATEEKIEVVEKPKNKRKSKEKIVSEETE